MSDIESIKLSFDSFEKHANYLVKAEFTKGLNIIRMLESKEYEEYKNLILKDIWLKCRQQAITCNFIAEEALRLSSEQLVEICKGKNILIFDRADLYLTEKVLKELDVENKIVIACLKQLSSVNKYTIKEYFIKVDNENKEINLVKY